MYISGVVSGFLPGNGRDIFLSIGVWSVGGSPDMTVMRNTVMLSMVEIPRVIFSPDSAGIKNTNLNSSKFNQSIKILN